MSSIFFSYAREDSAVALLIADTLRNDGFDVFYDVDLLAGESWQNYIFDSLKESDAVLVLLSERSAQSTFVNFEIGEAISLNKRVIPVLLGGEKAKQNFAWPILSGRQVLYLEEPVDGQNVENLSEDVWHAIRDNTPDKRRSAAQLPNHAQRVARRPVIRSLFAALLVGLALGIAVALFG